MDSRDAEAARRPDAAAHELEFMKDWICQGLQLIPEGFFWLMVKIPLFFKDERQRGASSWYTFTI
jgi:hypothetical protein